MTFLVRLDRPTRAFDVGVDPRREWDFSLYSQLAMYGCELLEQTDCAFTLCGFGRTWVLHVGYDASMLLEDLPDVLAFVHERRPGVIGPHSQGIERTLTFTPRADGMDIESTSLMGGVADPEREFSTYAELEVMLRRFATDFAASLTLVSPETAARQPFVGWARCDFG